MKASSSSSFSSHFSQEGLSSDNENVNPYAHTPFAYQISSREKQKENAAGELPAQGSSGSEGVSTSSDVESTTNKENAEWKKKAAAHPPKQCGWIYT